MIAQIKTENLHKVYNEGKAGECHAVRGVDLQIKEGEYVALIGSSGSGKSTLLHILGCADTFSDGEYYFEQQPLAHQKEKYIAAIRNHKIGFIQQDYALINTFTVFDNIALPLYIHNVPKAQVKEKVKLVAEQLRIEELLKKKANQLSGGQCQRVAIGRAIVANPPVILADEPTGALDTENTINVMEILSHLHKEGKTVIVATHDPIVANTCNRTIEMKDGKIVRDSKSV